MNSRKYACQGVQTFTHCALANKRPKTTSQISDILHGNKILLVAVYFISVSYQLNFVTLL